MSVKQTLIKAGLLLLLLGGLALQGAAQAQGAPEITPSLKKMLGGLQIDGIKDDLQVLLGSLKKTSCGGGLTGCYGTQTPDGSLQLYFFMSKQVQQTLLVVINQEISIPKSALPERVHEALGGTKFGTPIISLSTTSFDLVKAHMPPALQQVIQKHYFNVPSMNFEAGVQMAASAKLDGAVALAMNKLGVKGLDRVTLRTALKIPIPMDLAGGAGAGVGIADALQHGETFKKAGADALKPEAYVEFQLAPGTAVDIQASAMVLSDATFFLNNEMIFGFKGNGVFKGVEDKKVIVHFQGPIKPKSGLDLLEFQLLMATPSKFTLEDVVRIMAAMANESTLRPGHLADGMVSSFKAYLKPLLSAAKPLSAFQVTNPLMVSEYVFGDPKKPFPSKDQFNFAMLGPLAPGGPYLRETGNLRILGQKMGWVDAKADIKGFNGVAGAEVRIKLGPLGQLPIKMQSTVAINQGQQIINMLGNLDGQKISVTFGSKIGIEVNASCVNPFEIKASVEFTPDTDLAQIFDAQGGVNVDPSKISNCVGKELEAAYRKVAGEFKSLGGYSAAAATVELQKISDAAVKVAEEARREFNRVKDGARDVANKTKNDAANAFNKAGNAFKKIGKKKKHKEDDHRFAGSVFDWDYYYDHNPDLQHPGVDLVGHWRDSGFWEGRQGSNEFLVTYYLNRYLDVQQQCPNMDKQCALQHWIDYGVVDGRQGSPDFNVVSYMNRYGDVPKTLAKDADPDAMEHWLTVGSDAARNGRPDSADAGPISGPTRAGGETGKPWTDAVAGCTTQFVGGFNVRTTDTVQGLQFWYQGVNWAPEHGSMKSYTQVLLEDGDYIVAVDYRSAKYLDSVTFHTKRGKTYGPYGGKGGSAKRYNVTPGQKLGCMSGRSGGGIDQLIFSSTGPR